MLEPKVYWVYLSGWRLGLVEDVDGKRCRIRTFAGKKIMPWRSLLKRDLDEADTSRKFLEAIRKQPTGDAEDEFEFEQPESE